MIEVVWWYADGWLERVLDFDVVFRNHVHPRLVVYAILAYEKTDLLNIENLLRKPQ